MVVLPQALHALLIRSKGLHVAGREHQRLAGGGMLTGINTPGEIAAVTVIAVVGMRLLTGPGQAEGRGADGTTDGGLHGGSLGGVRPTLREHAAPRGLVQDTFLDAKIQGELVEHAGRTVFLARLHLGEIRLGNAKDLRQGALAQVVRFPQQE
jgi:hypothetical protein